MIQVLFSIFKHTTQKTTLVELVKKLLNINVMLIVLKYKRRYIKLFFGNVNHMPVNFINTCITFWF